MNTRQPKLSYHKHTGQYFVKWGGKFHWLGKDEKRASRLYYEEQIPAWAAWRASRDEELAAQPIIRRTSLTVGQLATDFLIAKKRECSRFTVEHLDHSLRRFCDIFKETPAQRIGTPALIAYRDEMLGMSYAAKTINHHVAAIKQMFQWGTDNGRIRPINLRAVRSLRVPPPTPKGYNLRQVKAMFDAADATLRPWIAINYLAALRPTEVVRLAAREGEMVERGVYRLAESKSMYRTGEHRHIVLSDLALKWFKKLRPRYSRHDSYGTACRRATGKSPHPLRHAAASRLLRLGVARADIDLFLGHLPPRVSLTYAPVEWKRLRPKVAKLVL